MKKRIGMIIAAALLLPLFGCSAKTDSAGTTAAPGTTAEAETTAPATTQPQGTRSAAGYVTREISCDNGGGQIYGVAYIADESRKTPLVIISHGLGANHQSCEKYAERLAENGYSAYVFDFPNGSNPNLPNKSGTDTLNMSVMTEADALQAVLTAAKSWDFADSSRVFLLGESQGGLVSAVTACDRPDGIAGVMLLYPALSIPEMVHESYASLDDVPETYSLFGWLYVGRRYAADVWDLDIYDKLSRYNGDVLIIHGDSDSIIDASCSERANEVLPHCELHIISGADHGFGGSDFEQAITYILGYLDKH